MISAISKLGSLALESSGKSVLSALTETINDDKYPLMLIIELDNNDCYSFQKIDLEGMNTPGATRYLYRRGSPRGANFSPTALITEIEKTFEVKMLGWFRSTIKRKPTIKNSELVMFTAIKDTLEKKKEKILGELQTKMVDIKDGAALTLKIGGRYLQEIPAFRNAFEQLIAAKTSRISAADKICSICGERKTNVSAGAPAYTFYTIDKPGSITGHFIRENSWRNYPVCSDCSLALDEGKRILERHFQFSFYGLRYCLIPQFMFGTPSELIIRIITGKMDKTIKINAPAGTKLTTFEDDILDILAKEKDSMSMQFLFLKKEQSAERILLLIEDVLPSRLRTLFWAKEEVDRNFPDNPFHLGRIRVFFAKSDEGKRENDLDKYFLEITDKIFKGLPVTMKFLCSHFMREIRRDFNRGDTRLFKATDAMESVQFFYYLQMLGKKEVNMTSTVFDTIFAKYNNQLDTPEKRGIFLLGALTKMLLNAQYAERKSQPFLVQLAGLKMDEPKIKGLLAKVENKFREYNRFDKGKAQVAESISRLFMESPAKWGMSIDELNFYFVCGMNLYNEVNMLLYGNKEEETADGN